MIEVTNAAAEKVRTLLEADDKLATHGLRMKVIGFARLKDGSLSGSALPKPVKEGWLNLTLILMMSPFLILRAILILGGFIFSAIFAPESYVY